MNKTLSKLQKSLSKGFSLLENSVGPFTKVVVGLAVLAGTALAVSSLQSDKSDITTSTVMITTMNEVSGGSGVIISSKNGKSTVLTNRHVCQVAKSGGLVKTTSGQKHIILNYRESQIHDLCLITVASELPGKVYVASNSPKMYEHATVSGHPALLPNVVTEGHFSGNKIIEVFTGLRQCTDADWQDEVLGGVCMFFGGNLPIIQTFEAVLITATIMPGSSGSAVYNSSQELGGLIFAGSGNIGYGFAVPYEYVKNFLAEEVKTSTLNYPNYTLDIKAALQNERQQYEFARQLRNRCANIEEQISDEVRQKVEQICRVVVKDLDWRKM